MDITAVCEALALNLAPLAPDVQVSPYVLASPTPPCVMVDVGPEEYGRSMGARGMTELTFIVWGLVPTAGAYEESQRRLHRWMATSGSESIKALLDSDKTLGGLGSLKVISRSGVRRYSAEGRATYIGAEWTVNVLGGA